MLLNAALVTAIPALGADELAANAPASKVARAGQLRRLQAGLVALLGSATGATSPLLGDAVLAVRATSIDPSLGATKEARPIGLVATPAVPTAVAADVRLTTVLLEEAITRAEATSLTVDGGVRDLELPGTMLGACPKRA